MIDISLIFNIFQYITSAIVILVIAVHILTRVLIKKKPVKLDNNSLVVITGACTGIGKEMVLELTSLYKCRLLIIDVRSDLFESLSQEISELGGKCECIKTDLSDKQSVQKICSLLLERKQNINIFIYNAGIHCPKKTWDTTQEEHQIVMRVNYFTPTIMVKKLQPLLSHIAVVGSMASLIFGGTNVSSYVSSKHAIVSYMTSLRQQYKKYEKNISVSIGLPYAINTKMFEGFKTLLDFMFPILDQRYVGKRLVKEFINRKEMCYIYEFEALLFKFIMFMPSCIQDFCATKLDVSQLQPSKVINNCKKND